MKSCDTESILNFVDKYEKDGIDKETALQAAVTIARGIWKRDHPDTSKLPDHLKPGNVMRSYSKAYAERRDRLAPEHIASKRV